MNNFVKYLFLIIIVCLIFKLSLKFKEKFFQEEQTNNVVNTQKIKIDFLLTTNKNQNKITLKFQKNKIYDIYFIIFYINNDGPYLTKLDLKNKITNELIEYSYDNILKNVLYKFSVIGIDSNNNLSDYKIKQIKLSIYDTINTISYGFDTKISCNPNGEHILSSKCLESIFPKLDTNIYNYNTNINNEFNEIEHEKLISNLNKENKEIINFV